MSSLKDKNIVLGITGSIAAYKAAEIISLLKKKGARVFPVMTEAATHFVHPTTYRSIAGERVTTHLFGSKDESLKHISLSEIADLLLIAPATANVIGKIASGIADDILTTTVMATRTPVLIAPAMHESMYENPVVQENIRRLRELGYRFIGPEKGRLASGAVGWGRMSEPEKIVDFLQEIIFSREDFKGKNFLVTAGPTRESLDRVRFISNYSSGKMGFAIAREARNRGAEVTLITGPTSVEPPRGVRICRVESASQMLEEVREYFKQTDVLIMVAAVADFRPTSISKRKIKKEGKQRFVLEFTRNPDILEEMGKKKNGRILVGFCAETENLMEEAKKKLSRKNLDLIVANDLTEKGSGFEVSTNKAVIIDRKGNVSYLPLMDKRELAGEILTHVKKLLEEK